MDSSVQVPLEFEQFINAEWEKAQPTLHEFLSIPSQSRIFDPEYITNGLLLKSAELLRDWILAQNIQGKSPTKLIKINQKGLTLEFLNDENYSPFIYCEVKGSEENDGTMLFYGHMDKQPPFTGWYEGLHPYIPVIRGDKLYARGAADDGYSIFGSVLALKACQHFGLKHSRIVMLFEGDEESGSLHIYHYLDILKPKIGTVDLVVCLDSGCGNYEQMWETSTLRGNCVVQFTVNVLDEGVHSGDASGIVPSSFRLARILMDRIENSVTGEVHNEFQVEIPQYRLDEAVETAKAIGKDIIEKFPYHQGMEPTTKDPIEAYLNRVWRAQLSTIGIGGMPPASIAGNVLRPSTSLKLSIRLPPTSDPEKIKELLLNLLTTNVPYNASVTIDHLRISHGWNCPQNKPFVHNLLSEASMTYFKKPALSYGEGGTIPLMNTLAGLYPESQFIVTGVLGPYSNAHGPNEFLHIPFTKKLICTIGHFVATSYEHLKIQK